MTVGEDQLEQLRQEVQEVRRMCLLLAAECADQRRALAAAGIQVPQSKLTTGRWLSVKEYAHECGIKYSGAMMRIKRHQVEAERHGGRWLINADVQFVQLDCTSRAPVRCAHNGQNSTP